MTDYMDLALKYGGFTSLDKVYLENTLSDLSDSQKLAFITPPPSVINAFYFAEIYQKQSPEAATDYYLDLSKELNSLTLHHLLMSISLYSSQSFREILWFLL